MNFTNNICYDSRKVKRGDIFFDFISNSKKDNPFIKEVVKKKPSLIISKKNLKYLKINTLKTDPKKFYLKLIKTKFKNIPKNLVGVTGTNGKTSIANFFYQINKLCGIKSVSVGTLGYIFNDKLKKTNLTTPDNLSIYKFLQTSKKLGVNNAILEASSHGLIQERLLGLNFNTAIFTNFTQDHLDYHKTMKSYLNAKLILFKKYLKKRGNIICNDKVYKILKKNNISNKKFKFVVQSKLLPFKIVNFKPYEDKTVLKINYKNKIFTKLVNLVGDIQIENLFQTISVCLISGINFNKIIDILDKIHPAEGRLNIFNRNKKIVCLDYAHTPDGLAKTILTLKKHFNRPLNLVFGCGGNRDKGKRPIMGKIANKYCKKVFITDDNPRFENPKKIRNEIFKSVPKAKKIAKRSLAIKRAIQKTSNKEILLIAGKGHEKYQVIKDKLIPFSDAKYIRKYL